MAYIRDGYIVISKSKKRGKKGYDHLGRSKFMCGESIKFLNIEKLSVPQKYWYKKFRLKIELEDE